MDMQLGLSIFSITLALLSVVFSGICVVLMLRNKNLTDALISQLDECENEIRAIRENNDGDSFRSSDHSRRIAWLETRIRKPEKFKNETLGEEGFAPKKSGMANMTERRHRVLTLAARGQDANSIAVSLGMLVGEVDLIMRLGRGANQYA